MLLLCSLLSACSDQQEDKQVSRESVDEPVAFDSPNDQVTNILLEDGFYDEQPRGDVGLQELPRDPLVDNEEIKNTDSKSLVENFEFSGAQENQSSDAEPLISKPFCLNENNQDADIESIIDDACLKISNRLASVKYTACEAAKLKTTGCSSVKGFPILMREFAPLDTRRPQGKILVIGGTHGDELTSVSVTLRWIEKLNQYHSGLFHWHLVPMMNPDGVLKRAATRTNENGVDLNRNMPSDDWDQNAIKYWTEKGRKDPRRYPGETASSEPESQWLIDEIKSFEPDAIISVHAPYGVVDFDSLLLNTAPKSLGKLRLNLLGTYPGSLGNYAGINLNIPVITLELPHSWVMPSEKETTMIWEDIVSWLKKNVNSDAAIN